MEMDGCFNFEGRIDFLQCLETDVCIHIMSFLDDPADVVRVGAVSHFWHQFVIVKGLAKQMCLKMFPQLSSIAGVVIGTTRTTMKKDFLERDHMAYATLLSAIKKSSVSLNDCVLYGISASTTDNSPAESIENTLYHGDTFMTRPSYWSSTGQSNPNVPEILIYRLKSPISVITEIDIKPFKAFFQHGSPIYSAKSVRFRMGHPKSQKKLNGKLQYLPTAEKCFDDEFEWTYTSPEFPMKQENVLQRFKLPKAAVCLGGYMQIELLGRIQRHENDGLFYMCMSHVRVVGRTLLPAFDMQIVEASGEMLLRYCPQFLSSIMQDSCVNLLSHLIPLEDMMLWE